MSEIQSLRNDYSSKERELNACTNEIAVLNGKIADLDILIKDFAELKSELQAHRNEFNQISNQTYDNWNGKLYLDAHLNMMSEIENTSLREYIKRVDNNLDELNNERMRLQNEIYSTEGIIGTLKSGMNWISTKINNLIN